jgi:predicted enzyme related to lactoylglutathione lyase
MSGRITGIGGVFIRPKNKAALIAWYRDTLGIDLGDAGFAVSPNAAPGAPPVTVFAIFDEDTDYFADATERFMINFAVEDIDGMVAALRGHGVEVADPVETEQGRFTWLTDPEGTRVELWEPAAMDDME